MNLSFDRVKALAKSSNPRLVCASTFIAMVLDVYAKVSTNDFENKGVCYLALKEQLDKYARVSEGADVEAAVQLAALGAVALKGYVEHCLEAASF